MCVTAWQMTWVTNSQFTHFGMAALSRSTAKKIHAAVAEKKFKILNKIHLLKTLFQLEKKFRNKIGILCSHDL